MTGSPTMIGSMVRMAAALACGAVALAAQSGEAAACSGLHIRVYPVCDVAAPRDDERVTLIYAYGGRNLSSAALGSDDNVTEVVDVEVAPADRPHYIALSSGKSIVWRFSGRVDTISRVIVLGSQLAGATRSGVIGVPRDRVQFVDPDLGRLGRAPRTTCHATYWACDLSTSFDIPPPDRSELAGTAPHHRYRVDQFIEHVQAGRIRIPGDGNVSDSDAEIVERTPDGWIVITHVGHGRQEYEAGADYFTSSASHDGVIAIRAEDVVSPDVVKPYDVLPSWAGIDQLLADGTLLGPSSERFKHAYDQWDEAISAPYRGPLDPDFHFAHKVDYLVARPTRLPAGLDGTVFLVDEGVAVPVVGGVGHHTCLFFADRRPLQPDRSHGNDPHCDQVGSSFALPEREQSLINARDDLERMRSTAPAGVDGCRQQTIPDDAYFVGIAAIERPKRDRNSDDGARRVDVTVKHPGRITLYLEMNGRPTDWHIAPSPDTEVVAVLLGSAARDAIRDEVLGLKFAVPVRQLRAPAGDSPCAAFNPNHLAYLGGPGAIDLDDRLRVLAGRGLDRLLRSNETEADPTPDGGETQPLTFVIE